MPGFFPHMGPKDRTLVLMFTQEAQHSLKYLLVHLYESSFSPSLQHTSFQRVTFSTGLLILPSSSPWNPALEITPSCCPFQPRGAFCLPAIHLVLSVLSLCFKCIACVCASSHPLLISCPSRFHIAQTLFPNTLWRKFSKELPTKQCGLFDHNLPWDSLGHLFHLLNPVFPLLIISALTAVLLGPPSSGNPDHSVPFPGLILIPLHYHFQTDQTWPDFSPFFSLPNR